jgi:DNA repair photolyase
MTIIYEPTGKAREYSPLAANLYSGCDHNCDFCFVPSIMSRFRKVLHCQRRAQDYKAGP